MRARTIELLDRINGHALTPSPAHIEEAQDLARQMMTDPALRPDFSRYPNETMALLAGLVAQTNCRIVDDLADLKLYVVNKLLLEIENAKDSRSRITALSKLGEIDGVDAFKKRVETTHIVKPIEEVEKELLKILENVEYSVVEEQKSA